MPDVHDPIPEAPAKLGPMKYADLWKTHPSLDLGRVKMLHALYKGGAALLKNDAVMTAVFPRHADESDGSYAERKARAFYEPVFAQVVNKVVAGLAQDPARLDPPKPEDAEIEPTEDADAKAKEDAKKLDPYWRQLGKDATPPNDDSAAKTFDEILRAVACEGFVAGRAWILCDMPPAPLVEAKSLGEQLEVGALKAYPVLYRANQVVDWYEESGVLLWVRSHSCAKPMPDPTKPRDITKHEWVIWTRDTWTKYIVEIDKEGRIKDATGMWRAPQETDDISPVSEGSHAFERVPWVCFDAAAEDEPNMFIGDLIESQVRNYFNQCCGDAYQRIRFMFQQLYEFLGAEIPGVNGPVIANQSDENRAMRQRRAPGVVQVRGQDDKAAFVAPDMTAAETTAEALDEAREGIFRVTGQLALSSDTSGATIRRSGDSKKQDKVEELVVLGAAGKKLLGFGRQVLKLLAIASKQDEPTLAGYENFDVDDTDDIVAQAGEVDVISIPSATFQREFKMKVARAVLGDTTDPSVIAQIRTELAGTITQDQFTMIPPSPLDPLDPEAPPADTTPPGSPRPPPFSAGKKPPPSKKPPPPSKEAA